MVITDELPLLVPFGRFLVVSSALTRCAFVAIKGPILGKNFNLLVPTAIKFQFFTALFRHASVLLVPVPVVTELRARAAHSHINLLP